MSALAFAIFFFCYGVNALRNVAQHKPVTLSSYSPRWPASNAVNGILSDHVLTNDEDNPYLRIDLGKNYMIHQIEVFSRQSCCGKQIHDLEVKVGKFLNLTTVYGYYSGFAKDAEQISFWCPYSTVGRHVQIQIFKGVNDVLTPAEVIVWGK
ncbi:fucolectin-like [Saccostrea cucullata]|uniref:fucolectin-like n=1 Tax=Saccostrea cuccullata TaxID=36930 RepID=UPI002ECFDD32